MLYLFDRVLSYKSVNTLITLRKPIAQNKIIY